MRVRLVTAFVLSIIASPGSAWACGMYIPPEKERLLTDLFEEIDAAPAVVEAPPVDVAARQVNADADASHNEAVADPAPSVIPEVAPGT